MIEDEEEICFDQQELLRHNNKIVSEKIKWRRRLLKTVTLSMAFFCLGLCIAIPGPTLLDLGRRVSRDTEHMTFIFTARSVGFLIGSLVGGILFDFFDQQILLFYTLAVVAVATAGVPWCSALLTLSFLICLQGVAIGVLDTGGNVFCIKIWGKRSGPFMQILHFAFGVGAFLAPLIARPFLMDNFGAIYDNSTQGSYHSVNSITLMSPAVKRLTRDLSGQFLDQDYGVHNEFSKYDDLILYNDTGQHQLSTKMSLWPINKLFTDIKHGGDAEKLKSLLFFQKREISVETVIKNLGNETWLLDKDAGHNLTTLIPKVSIERPKKPDFSDGAVLKKENADGVPIYPKLKYIKDKMTEQNMKVMITTTTVITSAGHDLNVTSQNEIVTNDAESLNNTGHFSDSGTSDILTSTITTVIASKSTTTPITTPVTTLIATSSATVMTSAAVTSTTTISETAVAATPAEASDIVTINSTTNGSSVNINKPKTTGDFFRDMVATLTGMSRIQFAYTVIGLLLAINAGLFLYLHCKNRSLKSQPYTHRYRDPARNAYTKCFVVSVVLLLFLFFLAYMGMEVTFGGLLTTFAVYYPADPWTPAQGATLTSLFWGCLALGRGVAIFIARCVKPSSMMVMNLCLTVVGAMILSFGVPMHPILLWVGTVTIGLGMSSLFPTAISWADSLYPLSGKATAVFVTGCGVGEMSVPALTGHLYENVSHMAIMYVTLFLSCVLTMLYFSVQLLVCRKGKSSPRRSHTGSVLLKNVEDVVDESDMGIVEGITLGITETTWRRRVQNEEERKKNNNEGNMITEFTKLMEI